MRWFKHSGTFRNSPPMKYIQRTIGEHGVAAAYRLFEVMTERYGVDNDFSGSLILSPPTTELWLAQEICTPDPDHEDSYGRGHVSDEQLQKYLGIFHGAGLIIYDTVTDHNGQTQRGDGSWGPADSPLVFKRITVPNFRDQADEYTARKAMKGLSTPE